ncbi:MAG: glycosyltransferase [Gudongella sp.]|nr:glycosyltransferase [Gudongella sp.]
MKVLQINSVCGIGSTGRIATDIHNILLEQGHESYVAYGRDLPKNCDNTIKIGTKFDNYSHVLKTRLLDMHGFGSINATREFIAKIEEINPDIVHLHNIHGYYINIKILFNYLKKTNMPVVWTLHDCWALTGHCSHFDYIGCDRWHNECHDCPQKKEYPSSILVDNSRNNFRIKKELFTGINNSIIVTPSEWLANLVKKSYLKEYPIKIINNGIDLEVFKPLESELRKKHNLEDKFIILGVANIWNERKGINYFLKLSNVLKDDEVIVLVGLTRKQEKQLPNNIISFKRTNSTEELAKIYTIADVFVNPTLEDNFPTTNLEAMACGIPVITFNTGGSIESIDRGTGFVVEKGNLMELYDKIVIIKANGKNTYLNNCLAKTKRLYDKKTNFIDYLELYNKSLYVK